VFRSIKQTHDEKENEQNVNVNYSPSGKNSKIAFLEARGLVLLTLHIQFAAASSRGAVRHPRQRFTATAQYKLR
jgi:hypothetical protein